MKNLLAKIPGVRQLGQAILNRYQHEKVRTRAPLALFRAAKENASTLKVVLGASGIFQPGWIPTEVDFLNIIAEQDWRKHFTPDSIQAMLAENVWEHLTLEEGRTAAHNCYQHLQPGGYLRAAVPDGNHPDPDYIEQVRVDPASGPKVLYTHRAFEGIFEEAGFEVVYLEYYDEYGVFHYTNWDPARGKIHRSRRFDDRNQDGELRYTSLILDAWKR